jgi:hypothetical protein
LMSRRGVRWSLRFFGPSDCPAAGVGDCFEAVLRGSDRDRRRLGGDPSECEQRGCANRSAETHTNGSHSGELTIDRFAAALR